MIKEIKMTIKMLKDLRDKTETEEMKTYYEGQIEGLTRALAIIRKH